MSEYVDVSVLKGKTLAEIEMAPDKDVLIFRTTDGEAYKMYHEQDCCEDVSIEDINGNQDDLIGSPLLVAEEVSGVDDGPLNEWDESYTWTFYKFATIKGSVTIRWYSTSNGYYSESVQFVRLDEKDKEDADKPIDDGLWDILERIVKQPTYKRAQKREGGSLGIQWNVYAPRKRQEGEEDE